MPARAAVAAPRQPPQAAAEPAEPGAVPAAAAACCAAAPLQMLEPPGWIALMLCCPQPLAAVRTLELPATAALLRLVAAGAARQGQGGQLQLRLPAPGVSPLDAQKAEPPGAQAVPPGCRSRPHCSLTPMGPRHPPKACPGQPVGRRPPPQTGRTMASAEHLAAPVPSHAAADGARAAELARSE